MRTEPATARRRADRPVPSLAIVGAGLGVLVFVLPLAGLLWRAPWSSAWTIL